MAEPEHPGSPWAQEDEPQPLLLRYIDERFASTHRRIDEVETAVHGVERSLHDRLGRMEKRNSEEHGQVVEALRHIGQTQQKDAERVDALEAVRDQHAGAWGLAKRVGGVVVGVAVIVGGAVAAASYLFG